MARRRRNNGTWLPTLGTTLGTGADKWSTGLYGAISLNNQGDPNVEIVPVLGDPSFQDISAYGGSALSSIAGSEYLLKRIVGKINVVVSDGGTGYYAKVVAGFFVARATQDLTGGEWPAGMSSKFANGFSDAQNWRQYAPNALETTREPWVWRRSWILASSPTGTNTTATFPTSNARYGSVLDGPHIDSKTKRRVGGDDRLWFAIGGSVWPYTTGSGAGTSLGSIVWDLDIRAFGALRRAKNKGAF